MSIEGKFKFIVTLFFFFTLSCKSADQESSDVLTKNEGMMGACTAWCRGSKKSDVEFMCGRVSVVKGSSPMSEEKCKARKRLTLSGEENQIEGNRVFKWNANEKTPVIKNNTAKMEQFENLVRRYGANFYCAISDSIMLYFLANPPKLFIDDYYEDTLEEIKIYENSDAPQPMSYSFNGTVFGITYEGSTKPKSGTFLYAASNANSKPILNLKPEIVELKVKIEKDSKSISDQVFSCAVFKPHKDIKK